MSGILKEYNMNDLQEYLCKICLIYLCNIIDVLLLYENVRKNMHYKYDHGPIIFVTVLFLHGCLLFRKPELLTNIGMLHVYETVSEEE